jgi:hypothetical protein
VSATADTAGAARDSTRPTAKTIDLRPLFAPRSIAVVGASPRSDTARILRDNITRVGGETRCFFVNPKYAAGAVLASLRVAHLGPSATAPTPARPT